MKFMEIKIQNIIKSLLLGILTALLLGKISNTIDYGFYCFTGGLIYILILFTYNITKNFSFYIYLTTFYVSNFVTYFDVVACSNEDYNIGKIIIIMLVYLIMATFLIITPVSSNPNNDIDKQLLYPERQADKNLIIDYLKNFQVFGVNGSWGDGKSFLMNNICNELSGRYYFIKINTTAYNADDVATVIINELDLLLQEHGILSIYSSAIKNLCKFDNSLNFIGSLFINKDNSNAKRIYGFGSELYKLDREIVIVFEDIDRIDDKKVIAQIFAVINNIINYSENIKVIYEYRQDKLIKLFNDDESFVEKYIPHTVNLTHINFMTILNRVYGANEKQFKTIVPDWFYFLCEDANFNYKSEYNKIGFMYNIVEDYFRNSYSARNLFNFMLEVDYFFNKNKGKSLDGYGQLRNTVITYFFIKHFYKEAYPNFNRYWSDIFTILKSQGIVKNKTNNINIFNFYNIFLSDKSKADENIKLNKELMSNESFKKSLAFIDCIGIRLDVDYSEFRRGHDKVFNIKNQVLRVDPETYRLKHNNDKIISLLKHLHEPGYLLKTREETLADIVIKLLTSTTSQITYEDYLDFDRYCRSEKYILEHHIQAFESELNEIINEIFVALYVSDIDETAILKFLDFYKDVYLPNELDQEIFGSGFISRFNYINIAREPVFWKALEIFNNETIPERIQFELKVLLYFTRIYFKRIVSLFNPSTYNILKLTDYDFKNDDLKNIEYIFNDFYPKVNGVLYNYLGLSNDQRLILKNFLNQYNKMLESINNNF